MRFLHTQSIRLCYLLLALCAASAASATESIESLRIELTELRQEYNARLSELEQRVIAAETAVMTAVIQPTREVLGTTAGNAFSPSFNPAISLVMDGRFIARSNNSDTRDVPGFQLGSEASGFDEGLLIGESELNLQANIDDKFFAAATIALEVEDGETEVALEEAYLQTTSLPAGFSIKAGQFFSDIGYINSIHGHATNFADTPLPYRVLFNGRLADAGLQLSWTPATPFYMQLGTEIFAGNDFPAAGAGHKGVGEWTTFAKLGGDFNSSHSWLAGVSFVSADAIDRSSGGTFEETPDDALFTGESDTLIGSLVWKWAPGGNSREKSFSFAAEYLSRDEEGKLALGEASSAYRSDQTGYYVEGVYKFRPRWRVGLRYDTLESSNTGMSLPDFLGTTSGDQDRVSMMLDFANSEFSLLRLQFVRDESNPTADDQFFIQYIMSMGAHSGHSF